MQECLENAPYFEFERQRLAAAIEENRSYLSVRAGHDVGPQAAQEDFLTHFLGVFARHFRLEHCRRCVEADRCTVFVRNCTARRV